MLINKPTKIRLKLIPRATGGYVDQVEIRARSPGSDLEYPTAIVHVDTFYRPDDKELYRMLNSGTAVIVAITIDRTVEEG